MANPENANPFFNFNTTDLPAYTVDAYKETIQLFGINVKYLPITYNPDTVNYSFGEMEQVRYDLAIDLRMSVEGYAEFLEGLADYNKFGFFVESSIIFTVGKDDYEAIVLDPDTGKHMTPSVGDIITFKLHSNDILMEISDTQLVYDSYYKFVTKLYNYDQGTSFDTGFDVVDGIDMPDDFPSIDDNKKIEENNQQHQNPNKQDNSWGSY